MPHLLSIAELSADAIADLWKLADIERERPSRPTDPAAARTVGWSFERNGVRTRTTFIQAFRDLGLAFTELPNLLKSAERVEDLAGYLDPFYAMYVVRESDHERLAAFARASTRPVINAMSRRGHPCEVLTDAYFVDRSVKPLRDAVVCLWGPTTNVFRSWHELAGVLGVRVIQVCDERWHEAGSPVHFTTRAPARADVVLTDAWPAEAAESATPLTLQHLAAMGDPLLLPTPPFTIGREIAFDPRPHPRFAGYAQKQLLLPVQKAIVRFFGDFS